jgi:hypothetical protein
VYEPFPFIRRWAFLSISEFERSRQALSARKLTGSIYGRGLYEVMRYIDWLEQHSDDFC